MYEQEITRRHRTAFIIVIDQSQSMLEEVPFNGDKIRKATAVSEVTDNIIMELILRAKRDEGIRDYYDVAVIGYSDDKVYSLLDPNRNLIPVTELYNYVIERKKVAIERVLPDGRKNLHIEQKLHWVKPLAQGNTPTYEAMLYVRDIVKEWCQKDQHADSFPPVIFHITDGNSSDCNPLDLFDISEQIRSLSTNDGNVLLINIHLASSAENRGIIFPADDEIDSDNHCLKMLAECSSYMPAAFNEIIRLQRGCHAVPPFRAVSYNASITELIAMLNIGSRSITNLH